MNRNYFIIPLLLIMGLFLASCTSNSNNPVTANPVGNIYVTSTPTGAQILLDGTNTGKTTNDTLKNVSVGNHTIALVLANYTDTTTVNTVSVSDGATITVTRTLAINKDITAYGPVRVWESADPLATDPSGLVLKSGQAVSIGAATFGPVDIYYNSNGFVVEQAFGHNSTGRKTSFFVGTSSNLNDSVSSPAALSTWVTKINDTETNYFFLFDADSHYSKMKITSMGGGTPGNPAWIEVQWLYNNKANDQRF
jgi:hypothetical protein